MNGSRSARSCGSVRRTTIDDRRALWLVGWENDLRTLIPQVLAGLVRRGEDFDAAEDALQEALIEALRVWPEHPPRNPPAWLTTVTTRRLIDVRRSQASRARREDAICVEPQPGACPQPDWTRHSRCERCSASGTGGTPCAATSTNSGATCPPQPRRTPMPSTAPPRHRHRRARPPDPPSRSHPSSEPAPSRTLRPRAQRRDCDAVRVIVEQRSVVGAPVDLVWNRVVSPEGINDELSPWMTMSLPRGITLRIDDVKVGVPIGRCWLRLFGVVPFDYDRLTLVELEPGRRFHEKSSMLSMRRWEHERIVEPAGRQATVVFDRVTLEARLPLLTPFVAAIIGRFFEHRHRRLARHFDERG